MLKILQNTNKHPSASWLYNELKTEFMDLSISSIYRNLNILLDQNLVRKIRTESSFDHYDANTDLHYHFICRLCDSIIDINVDVFKDLNNQASEATGYRIEGHRLDFYGACPSCYEEK